MTMYRLIIGLFAVVCFIPQSNGNAWVEDTIKVTRDDSLAAQPSESEIEGSEFLSNLDSLLNLWYVEKSISYYDDRELAPSDTVIPVFSDSVYRQVLRKTKPKRR